MSGFDENPFADPAMTQPTTNGGGNLGTYDPFTKEKQETVSGIISAPTEVPPPQYQAGPGQQTATTADFQRRQEELERKAAELERREEELKSSPFNARVNNWPPLPAFIPLQPCFHQDINVDIPIEFQEVVKRLYYLWLFHAVLLLGNMLGGLCFLFGGLDNGTMFGMSLVYVVLNIPLSFLCWFRPVYKAFRTDSSISFMIFFLTFGLQFLFVVIMAIGIPSTGGSGWITAIVTFKGGNRTTDATGGDYFIGVIVLIVAVGFSVAGVADFYMLTRVHNMYRVTGASVSKAQAELANGVMSNEGVRSAAASAVVAGAKQGFQQN